MISLLCLPLGKQNQISERQKKRQRVKENRNWQTESGGKTFSKRKKSNEKNALKNVYKRNRFVIRQCQ